MIRGVREPRFDCIVEDQVKVKSRGKMRDAFLWVGRRSIVLLQDSQASPARPDKSRVKVEALVLLTMSSDRGRGIFIF
jgi:hypothetical protein